MASGRKPFPYQILESTNDKAHLSKEELEKRKENEPQIESRELKCPKHLSVEAKKEFNKLVKLYSEIEPPILNDLDINALEVYCESMATYRNAMEKVRASSEVYKSDKGAKMNPWLRVANTAAMEIKKFGEILLLDPVSRARVGLAKAKEDPESADPMEKMIRGW